MERNKERAAVEIQSQYVDHWVHAGTGATSGQKRAVGNFVGSVMGWMVGWAGSADC